MSHRTSLIAILFLSAFIGCGGKSGNQLSNIWQYPVKLGDTRATVHKCFSNPARTTPVLEEYPTSGLTVWYDGQGKVTKLNFLGPASALYSPDSFTNRPVNHNVLLGLSGLATESDFRRVLGTPEKDMVEGAAQLSDLRCLWKKDGFIIDALFLPTPRTYGGKTLPVGTLLWFEVYRGV